MHILANVDYGRALHDKIPGAPSFCYWEFVSSEMAIRNNIANVPSEAEWQNIELLARTVLQPVRTAVGKLKINSGFRCKLLNDLVGSNDKSFHRLGCAADVDPLECSLMELLKAVMELPVTEVIAEYFPNGWVHVGFQAGRNDTKLKLKDANHKYDVVTLEYIENIYG